MFWVITGFTALDRMDESTAHEKGSSEASLETIPAVFVPPLSPRGRLVVDAEDSSRKRLSMRPPIIPVKLDAFAHVIYAEA